MTDNEIKEDCLQEAGIDLGRYSHTELTEIKDALRRYHNAKLKLLRIADVSGQSEQSNCVHSHEHILTVKTLKYRCKHCGDEKWEQLD